MHVYLEALDKVANPCNGKNHEGTLVEVINDFHYFRDSKEEFLSIDSAVEDVKKLDH